MTTSSSTDFELDALGIVTKSFQKLGIRAAETPLEDFEIQDGLDDLNLMLKGWSMQGLHLWTMEEGVVFLDVGKENYLLGPSGDEACNLDDFIGTTTTIAGVTTDVIIPVTSSSGMVAADVVGIKLDTGVRHWTTIVSVDSSTQITITAGLPSAAASAATVFTFTTLIERPLRISSTRRQTFANDSEIPVESWSRDEYFNQTVKGGTGTVNSAYYSPLLINGRIYVWQTASDCNDYLRITFERLIQDIDLSTETLDIPTEMQECVIYNLAARLTESYTVPPRREASVNQKAAMLMTQALGWDEEIESIFVQPSFN